MTYQRIFSVALVIGTIFMLVLAAKVIFDGFGPRGVYAQYFMFYSALCLALNIGATIGVTALRGSDIEGANLVTLAQIGVFISVLSALLLPPFFSVMVLAVGFGLCFAFIYRSGLVAVFPQWYLKIARLLIPFAIGANMAVAFAWYG